MVPVGFLKLKSKKPLEKLSSFLCVFLTESLILKKNIYLRMLLLQNLETNFALFLNITVFFLLGIVVLYYTIRYIEQFYAEIKKKPLYLNFILLKKDLSKSQRLILEHEFSFYNQLSSNEKSIFRHRVYCFIDNKSFHGRNGLNVTEKIKVLISATAVMLTFGFKNYKLPIVRTILVYPESFYSKQNEQFHKGEMNPKLGVIALSWKDFKHGFDIDNDNLNLGIHEFGHAIHFNSYKNNDVSSLIFRDGFKDLKSYLKSNEAKRRELIQTKYFREYAYTNEFEFVAVLIECFFETPLEFKTSFPRIYNYVKLMLNFNFAGY